MAKASPGGRQNLAFRGEEHSIADWGRITGLSGHTISQRLGDGWSVQEALTIPRGQKREYPKPLPRKSPCEGCAFWDVLGASGKTTTKCCNYAWDTGNIRLRNGPDGRGHAPVPCPYRRNGKRQEETEQ
ncbi:MAG: hypothetical protein LUH36_07150 [Oscillospiraceae bacterium]|nr:hypothetical protein [Oscillospiraceae bacterium]